VTGAHPIRNGRFTPLSQPRLQIAGRVKTGPFAPRIEDARRAAVDLQRVSDDLDVKLAKLELTLQDMALGVSASVPLDVAGAELAFRKIGATWGLLIEFPDERRPVSLHSALPPLRLAAADNVHHLVDELLRRTTEEVGAFRMRVAKVDALIAELSPQSPSDGRDSRVRTLPR
jgi:hypothetical protein